MQSKPPRRRYRINYRSRGRRCAERREKSERSICTLESETSDWEPLPSLSELTLFAAELVSLAEEISEARLNGFLREALETKPRR